MPRTSSRLTRLVADRRDEILAIAAQHGASNVRLIGSVARGEDQAASDIDFVVRVEPGRSVFDLARLQRDLEALLGTEVDVVSEGGLVEGDEDGLLADAVLV